MKYGLIGKPLGHSYSREIHRLIADYDYELKELDESEVGKFLQDRQFAAINVTIPYKQTVMQYLDFISDDAKNIGAVNTIVNDGGKLCGYNTDFLGMRALIEKSGISVKGKKGAYIRHRRHEQYGFCGVQGFGCERDMQGFKKGKGRRDNLRQSKRRA